MKLDNIQNTTLKIFKVYNTSIRTPLNWSKERAGLMENPARRASWEYKIPDLRKLKNKLINLKINKNRNKVRKSASNLYAIFATDVAQLSLENSFQKLQVLEALKGKRFKSDLKLRRQFYGLKYDYSKIVRKYNVVVKKGGRKLRLLGSAFSKGKYTSKKSATQLKKILNNVRLKIENIVSFPGQIKKGVLKNFISNVKIVEDPSFLMRCITDPKTGKTSILLNKNRKYSMHLLKIGTLHEFAGHALEMALFDRTLVANKTISRIYSYAGVSSPNIFDVKAEVFADKVVYPFLTKKELKFMKFRREVWLLCRAMADYTYHIKHGTIKDVMEIYNNAGLNDFAFDEAIMTSIFIDGYQGMYIFANELAEKVQKELKLNNKQFLTLMLLCGKIPLKSFTKFLKHLKQGKLLIV